MTDNIIKSNQTRMNAQQTKLNATAAELTHKEVCIIASAGETVVGLLFFFGSPSC